MGCRVSRECNATILEKHIDTPRFVIGTAVDPTQTDMEEEELFRCGNIAVARVHPGYEDQFRYHLRHGKAHASFRNQVALIEAFLSEIRAHHTMGISCPATVAVTNSSGVNLTHILMWKEPIPYHDKIATSKLTNILHSFSTKGSFQGMFKNILRIAVQEAFPPHTRERPALLGLDDAYDDILRVARTGMQSRYLRPTAGVAYSTVFNTTGYRFRAHKGDGAACPLLTRLGAWSCHRDALASLNMVSAQKHSLMTHDRATRG